VAPDLVAYEVTKAIWNHEHLIKNVKIGNPYISIFYCLIDAGKIKIPTPNKRIDTEIIFDCKRASNYNI
jgi:hypothetical protein